MWMTQRKHFPSFIRSKALFISSKGRSCVTYSSIWISCKSRSRKLTYLSFFDVIQDEGKIFTKEKKKKKNEDQVKLKFSMDDVKEGNSHNLQLQTRRTEKKELVTLILSHYTFLREKD